MLMVRIFNSLSLPRKKSTLVLPVLSSRSPISHRRRAGVAQGMNALVHWHLDGVSCKSFSTPAGRWLCHEDQDIQRFGILSCLPQGVLGSVVWVPGQNITLADHFLFSGAVCVALLSPACWVSHKPWCAIVQWIKWGKGVKLEAKGCCGHFSLWYTSQLAQEMLLNVGFGEVVQGYLQLLAISLLPAAFVLPCIIVPVELGQKCPVAFSSPACSSPHCSRTNLIK